MRVDAAGRGGGRTRYGLLLLATAVGLTASACASQPATSPASSSGLGSPVMAQAEATDGPYTLTFDLPRTTWSASEAIEGTASRAVAADVEVGGSGEGLLGFQYGEIGGLGRHMEWVVTADCQPYQLIAGQPINSGLTKDSGYSPTASGADFYASFFADPAVHLPAGDWTITARAAIIGFLKRPGLPSPVP